MAEEAKSSRIEVEPVRTFGEFLCYGNRVMKALADNNLRTAEVSLFNGENGGPRSIPEAAPASDNRADSKLK